MELLVSLAVIIPCIIAISSIVLFLVRIDVQRWILKEVVSLLKNDDTPVAVYAHQSREEAKAAKEEAIAAKTAAAELKQDVRETHEDVRQIRDLLVQHITDSDLHRGKAY